jgi:hypothetical protein
MGNDCSTCSKYDTFNPEHYIKLPAVNRELVLQIHAAFDYFEPVDGVIVMKKLPESRHSSKLMEIFRNYDVVAFDDFYTVMKEKFLKRAEDFDHKAIDFEETAAAVSCLFWPWRDEETGSPEPPELRLSPFNT